MDDKELSNLIKKEISKSINSKVDLNELDEISAGLYQIKKSIKPYRLSSLFLVAILGISTGYALNIYKPIVPSKNDKFLKRFEDKGLKLGEDKTRHYILIPSKLKLQKVKNGYAVIIKK